jgi:hypothetical protein
MTRDEQRNYIIHWIHGRMGGLQDVLHIARFYKRMLLDQHLDRLLRTVAQAVRRLHVSPLFYFGVVSGLEDWDAWGGLRGWPHALGEETHIDLDAAEIDELGKVVPQIWIDALQLSVAEWDPTSMKRHYEDLRSTC